MKGCTGRFVSIQFGRDVDQLMWLLDVNFDDLLKKAKKLWDDLKIPKNYTKKDLFILLNDVRGLYCYEIISTYM